MITSTGNERIRHIAALGEKARLRRQERCFVAEGERFFADTPPEYLREVYVTEAFLAQAGEKVRKKLDACGSLVETVTEQALARASSTVTPQGIVCVLSMPSHDMDAILGGGEREPLILLLENIQDPGNLGTLFRTAEAAGATGVLLGRGCVDLFAPKTVRATMSALLRLPFYRAEDFCLAAGMLRDRGVRLYAAHLAGARDYDGENYTGPSGFMIGNEANGLTDQAAALADARIRIPMEGEVESLNAAMAGGILLYEASRQRRKP